MKNLSCENKNCDNRFRRYLKDISRHNYCSRSCAATINNHFYPKRKKMLRCCGLCGKLINQKQKFCSLTCRIKTQKKYSRGELLNIIKNTRWLLNRTPARRELGMISYACIREFNSWNKAVIEAGFQPYRSASQKMYRRMRTKALDGHKCDSISEVIIDNWLAKHDIPHLRDAKYPNTNYKTDWIINNNTFVEYFGLAQDCFRYDLAIKNKKELAKKHSINLIEIYPNDLYPEIRLANKLNFKSA